MTGLTALKQRGRARFRPLPATRIFQVRLQAAEEGR